MDKVSTMIGRVARFFVLMQPVSEVRMPVWGQRAQCPNQAFGQSFGIAIFAGGWRAINTRNNPVSASLFFVAGRQTAHSSPLEQGMRQLGNASLPTTARSVDFRCAGG